MLSPRPDLTSSRSSTFAPHSPPPTVAASETSNGSGLDVRLSTREHLIVLLMGRGLTNAMIACRLSISPGTVRSHARCIFGKLAVQTRAQAVFRASALGLI